MVNTRREFLGGAVALGSLMLLPEEWGQIQSAEAGATGSAPSEYQLPALPYAYDALEPYIDEQTLRIHHDKHHAGYTKGMNQTLQQLDDARSGADYAQIQQLSRALAFHASGYFNHLVYWSNLAPAGSGGGGTPTGALAQQIERDFGSFERFHGQFSAATAKIEGSGWGVLAWHPVLRRLIVQTLMNHQDLSVVGAVPLLFCDVWEHAYYLKYQNRRAEHIEAWWKVVNWPDVAKRFGMHQTQ